MTKLIWLAVIILIVVGIINLFGKKLNIKEKEKSFQKFPYKKKNFMTNNELSFYKKLEIEHGEKNYIIPQVPLASIVDVDLPRNFYAYKGYRYKIDKKNIDYVLFNKETFNPVMAIELDDSSHLRSDRQERDKFVNDLFEKVGIKLERKY